MYSYIYNGATIKSRRMIGIARVIYWIQVREFNQNYLNLVEQNKPIPKYPNIREIYKNMVGRYPTEKQLLFAGFDKMCKWILPGDI